MLMLRELAVIFAVTLCAAPVHSQAPDARTLLSDAEIATGLSEQLTFDDVLRLRKINVEVKEGIALLNGTVASLFEKDRAVAVAETIRGVRAVVNRIKIDQAPRDDAELLFDVRAALKAAPATESGDLSVDVHDGHVTLSGTADSHAEKLVAEQVAKTVRGVGDVANDITIQVDKDRPDQELKTEIKRRLQSDTWVRDDLIRVDVKNGTVTLSGTVGSVSQKYVAEVDAFVAGVEHVDASQLEVDSEAVHDVRRARKHTAPRHDETIDAVKDALRYDPRVASQDISVAFRAGTIHLTGTVNTLSAKRAAEQDALRTRYVARVDNRLEVQAAPKEAEANAAAAIEAALARDIYVADDDIAVEVAGGLARLTGSINLKTGKQRAESIAEGVRGITSVDNQLTIVESTKPPTDLQIRYGIRNRLYWSSTVDDSDITVLVSDGAATLNGEVDDRAAFDSATQAALNAGASEVNNRLIIREHLE